MINLILRSATLILFAVWRIYWLLTKKEAEISKPKTNTTKRAIGSIMIVFSGSYIIANLVGFVLFPFHINTTVQIIGFILFMLGFFEAMVARKTLADNWTESYEYQIKKNHELITKGIYRYVRHPIYGGLILMSTGALLVSSSYTFIAALIIMLIAAEIFAQREEKLLTKHFGKKYLEYMKTTKKFIPFIY
ncbi:MAG: isoprenylcysteine carboxyl methyltransferase [uncultured bacterium]|nr:MAG: isoprenylcysteine carboxyl methyltransferase [uncultured bacterium]